MQAREGAAAAKQASREVRAAVLREAEIVVSTLITAGGDLLSLAASQRGFDAVIIDEVSPSVPHPPPAKPCQRLDLVHVIVNCIDSAMPQGKFIALGPEKPAGLHEINTRSCR